MKGETQIQFLSSVPPTEPKSSESFRKRIELLSRLAAELTVSLEALELVVVPADRFDIAQGINFYDEVRDFEIRLIRQALRYVGGSQLKAARLLNLARSTLSHKIKVYKIDCPAGRHYLPMSDQLSSELEVAR